MFISAVQYFTPCVVKTQNDKDAKVLTKLEAILHKHLPQMESFLKNPSVFPDGMASERDPIHTHMLRGDIMENSTMMPDFKTFFNSLTTDQKQLVFAFLVYIDTGLDKVNPQFLRRVRQKAIDFLKESIPHDLKVTNLNRLRPQVRDLIPINRRLALHGMAALFIRECRLVFQPKIAASMDHHFDSMRQSIRETAFETRHQVAKVKLYKITAIQLGYKKGERVVTKMPISIRVDDPKTKSLRQIDTDDSKVFWLEKPRNLYFIEFRDFTRDNITRYIVGDFPLGKQVEKYLLFESRPEALSACSHYKKTHQALADIKPFTTISHSPKEGRASRCLSTIGWCTII